MEGRARAAIKRDEMLISGAWHSGAFGGAAQAGKLKPLKHYLSSFQTPPRAQSPEDILQAFMDMQERGAPMTIRRLH